MPTPKATRVSVGPIGSENQPAVAQNSIDRRRPYSDSRRGVLASLAALLVPLPDRPGWQMTSRFEIESAVPTELEEAQAQVLLSEAEALYASQRERAQGAESRATTLQGAVGVAAGLILAGANFVLDPARVADRIWRVVFAGCLAALLMCLVLSGWLATNANLKFFTWLRPKPAPILRRACQDVAQADRERAIDLIAYANANYYVAAFKVAQLRAAARWFRGALSLLGLLALLLAAYVSFGPVPK